MTVKLYCFIKVLHVRGEGCGKRLYLEGTEPGGINGAGVDWYRIARSYFWVCVVRGDALFFTLDECRSVRLRRFQTLIPSALLTLRCSLGL